MLERYAKEKEQEFAALTRVLSSHLKDDELTEEILKRGLKLAFQYGHHAGHCRGEIYRTKTLKEWAR